MKKKDASGSVQQIHLKSFLEVVQKLKVELLMKSCDDQYRHWKTRSVFAKQVLRDV